MNCANRWTTEQIATLQSFKGQPFTKQLVRRLSRELAKTEGAIRAQALRLQLVPKRKTPHQALLEEEKNLINTMAGDKHFAEVVNQINRYRTRQGLPPRTYAAVLGHARRLGVSIKAEGDFYSLSSIANGLGIQPETISNWLKNPEVHNVLKPRVIRKAIRKGQETYVLQEAVIGKAHGGSEGILIRPTRLRAFFLAYPGLVAKCKKIDIGWYTSVCIPDTPEHIDDEALALENRRA